MDNIPNIETNIPLCLTKVISNIVSVNKIACFQFFIHSLSFIMSITNATNKTIHMAYKVSLSILTARLKFSGVIENKQDIINKNHLFTP